MKKLIFKFAIFIFVVGFLIVSYFTQPSAEINKFSSNTSVAIPDTQFQIGAINSGWLSLYNYIKNDLNFNVWHYYTRLDRGWNKNYADNYLAQISQYQGIVTAKVGTNNTNQLRTYFDRPIVEYVIAGQRTDYECEVLQSNNIYRYNSYKTSVNDYTLMIHDTIDISKYGSGETVKYCKRDNNNPGRNACWIDSGLWANRNLSNTGAANWWCNDNAWDWYVMPRIRIDSVYAADTAHNQDTVCRIKITGWYGNIAKEIGILVENFKSTFQSIYRGNYLDTFHFYIGQGDLILNTSTINDYFLPDSNHWVYEWKDTSKVDIKIYWTGKCDMWIDRVRIENEPAHQYMTLKDSTWINKVDAEIGWANNTKQIPNYFYFEEFTLSHVPAIAALNKQILANSQPQNSNGLIVWLNNYQINEQTPHFVDSGRLFTSSQIKTIFKDTCKISTMMIGCYPFGGWSQSSGQSVSYHPNTLYSGDFDSTKGILSYSATPPQYDTWLQERLDANSGLWDFTYIFKMMDELSKEGFRIINCPQAHLFHWPGGYLKEPSNQEIELQTDLALTYNAKGIMYYYFDSFGKYTDAKYGKGIMNDSILNNGDTTLFPRHKSVYDHDTDKYGKIKELSLKLNKWGPYIMSFNPENTHSYIYRTESYDLIANTYIKSVYTYPSGNPNLCPQTDPNYNVPDAPNNRYIQAAVFKKSSTDFDNYFMLVNRRCAPGTDPCSGYRRLRVQFGGQDNRLNYFNNWKVIDLYDNSTIGVFDKTISDTLDFGWYKPGEGKLYKLTPVMVDGGTLVCDEEIGEISSFDCKGEVIGNGKKITIPNKITISFHPEGKITMNGGQFVCGLNTQSRADIIFQGTGTFYWDGFSLSNCTKVELLNCKFLKSPDAPPDTSEFKYSLKITNCKGIDIENCDFIYTNAEYSGTIKIDYLQEVQDIDPVNIYGNIISTDISTAPALNIISYASNEMPFVIEYNEFTGSNNNITNNAMLLSNVTGGALKNNTITNYLHSIIFYSSSIDFYDNSITCDREDAEGIMCFAYSQIHMNYAGDYKTGGNNSFTNYGNSSRNVEVSNSMFYIEDGYNSFDIFPENSSYHLKGDFPSEEQIDCIKATQNCFKISSKPDTAYQDVTWGVYDPPNPVNFLFDPTDCESWQQEDYIVFQLQNNIKDTVRKTISTVQNTPLNALYDSININVRENDYQRVSELGYSFLNLYPDSIESVDISGKLYLASLVLDSSGSKIQPLKSYYENLIQNHPQNTALISRAYYFIQKCKVALEDYQSALTGFQNIMNQNPYSHEGLLASWDYSATTLLMGSGGSVKEQLPIDEFQFEANENSKNDVFEAIITQMLDSLRKNRKTINTNSTNIIQNKIDNKKLVLTKNVESVFENNRKKTENRIKDLEKKIKSDNDKIRKDAAKELIQMKKLGEVIKVRNPKDIAEHIKFVNRDIKKVFGGSSTINENKKTNIIPTEYALHQNYPNPFNPITKISFDLPKDSKVKLIVYDILGREVTRLLNSEFKTAGKYVVEFNAVNLNLSSGVYFYRIETDKFIAVKKMLMIK